MKLTKEQTAAFLKLHRQGIPWPGVASGYYKRPACLLTSAEVDAVRKAAMRKTWPSEARNPSHKAKNMKNGDQHGQKCQNLADLAADPRKTGRNTTISAFEDVSGSENELTINKTVFLDPDTPKTPETILRAFGYDPVL